MVTTGARASQILRLVLAGGAEHVRLLEGDVLDFEPELAGQQHRGVVVDGVVEHDAGHAHAPQLLEHVGRLDAHALGDLADGDGLVHLDDALVRRRRRDLRLLLLLAELRLLLALLLTAEAIAGPPPGVSRRWPGMPPPPGRCCAKRSRGSAWRISMRGSGSSITRPVGPNLTGSSFLARRRPGVADPSPAARPWPRRGTARSWRAGGACTGCGGRGASRTSTRGCSSRRVSTTTLRGASSRRVSTVGSTGFSCVEGTTFSTTS